MGRFLSILLLLLIPMPSFAADVVKLYAGANAIWFDAPTDLPSDFEAGGNASASLSPHISLVAGLYFGVRETYTRASFGPRITVTDTENPNFSIGIGFQRNISSEPGIRPEEWAPEVSIGWRPWPVDMRRLIVGAQGTYGLDSDEASALVAVRYELAGFGKGVQR